jgi:membrane protein implicated in regulation of membrane protease activity
MINQVYTLIALAVVKLFLDLWGHQVVATWSVLLEAVIYGVVLVMIIRTSLKRREGRREKLQRKIRELNEMLSEL